jgi:AcrR family transcriptional regulator
MTSDRQHPHGSGSTDRRSAEERREQLIDAAIEVIAAEGLARATTRAITDRAGLALGAFHYVFDSKDELLEAVMQRIVGQIDATLGAAAAVHDASAEPPPGAPDGLVDVLERFLRGAWAYFESSRTLQLARCELTLHALRDPDKHHLAVQQYELLAGTLRSLLRGVTDELDDAASDELRATSSPPSTGCCCGGSSTGTRPPPTAASAGA